MLLLFAIPFALAGEAHLVAGEPDFTGCLESPSCAEAFYRFLGQSMTEQGFTFQHDALLTSATIDPTPGFVVGAMIDTFPLGPPPENLSGKEENTQFSPVLPRFVGGWRSGKEGVVSGAGAFFLPPIPVGGASALVAGVDLSVSRPLGETRIGLEGDFTYTRARAPIVATPDQLEDRENWNNPDNLDPDQFAEICGEAGCKDTFVVTNLGVRTAVAVPAGPVVAWGKLGLAYVNERLHVQYDDTTWALAGLQPSVHLGGSLPIGIVNLVGGGVVAYKPPVWSESDQAGVYWKLEGAAGVRF